MTTAATVLNRCTTCSLSFSSDVRERGTAVPRSQNSRGREIDQPFAVASLVEVLVGRLVDRQGARVRRAGVASRDRVARGSRVGPGVGVAAGGVATRSTSAGSRRRGVRRSSAGRSGRSRPGTAGRSIAVAAIGIGIAVLPRTVALEGAVASDVVAAVGAGVLVDVDADRLVLAGAGMGIGVRRGWRRSRRRAARRRSRRRRTCGRRGRVVGRVGVALGDRPVQRVRRVSVARVDGVVRRCVVRTTVAVGRPSLPPAPPVPMALLVVLATAAEPDAVAGSPS